MKIILIVMLAFVTGCGNTADSTSNATEQVSNISEEGTYQVLTAADFKAKMASLEDYHLVDVRTPGEVASGTIENAVNINYSTSSFATELGKLDKEKPLMLFCRSGARSGRASQIAKDLGFTEIYDLRGGIMAWPRD